MGDAPYSEAPHPGFPAPGIATRRDTLNSAEGIGVEAGAAVLNDVPATGAIALVVIPAA